MNRLFDHFKISILIRQEVTTLLAVKVIDVKIYPVGIPIAGPGVSLAGCLLIDEKPYFILKRVRGCIE